MKKQTAKELLKKQIEYENKEKAKEKLKKRSINDTVTREEWDYDCRFLAWKR